MATTQETEQEWKDEAPPAKATRKKTEVTPPSRTQRLKTGIKKYVKKATPVAKRFVKWLTTPKASGRKGTSSRRKRSAALYQPQSDNDGYSFDYPSFDNFGDGMERMNSIGDTFSDFEDRMENMNNMFRR